MLKKYRIYTILAGILFASFFAAASVARAEENNLVLQWVNFTKEGVLASVQNQGKEAKDGVELLFEWIRCAEAQCSLLEKPYEWKAETALQGGETRLVSWTEREPLGVQRVRVTLDPKGKITETNEDDNAWEERPISPKTSGKTLVLIDADFLKIQGKSPRLLPGSVFYFIKDAWREVRIAVGGNKAEERLRYAQDRLLEMRYLKEGKKYGKISEAMRVLERDFEKAEKNIAETKKRQESKARQLEAKEVGARTRTVFVTENILTGIPREFVAETQKARQEIVAGAARRIFETKENEEVWDALKNEIEKRNTSPFFALQGLKLLDEIAKQYPDKEGAEIKNSKKKIFTAFEERMSAAPEEIQGSVADYVISMMGGEESAKGFMEGMAGIGEKTQGVIGRAIREIKQKEIEAAAQKIKKQNTEEGAKQKNAKNDADVGGEVMKKETEASSTEKEEMVCAAEFNPVCGKNDITYANECEAKKAGAEITEKGACKLALPDLVMREVGIEPLEIEDKDWINIKAVIANDGGTTQELFYVRLRIDADRNGIHDVLPNEYPLNLMTTSSSVPIAWKNVWQAAEGVHQAELCADPAKKITESNELNNCAILAFPVGPAPTSTFEDAINIGTSTSAGVSE